ncbi:hypothetical protein HanPI659440_Chr12g0463971 [Helianthus annuus]|nr:hypothetical protein HanIR_Chr12g0588661 [Helianthus annuus]KAJ0725885.1 hypothetical protein HanPI659440_Chr12g0463971 [Helianthus annuus]
MIAEKYERMLRNIGIFSTNVIKIGSSWIDITWIKNGDIISL